MYKVVNDRPTAPYVANVFALFYISSCSCRACM